MFPQLSGVGFGCSSHFWKLATSHFSTLIPPSRDAIQILAPCLTWYPVVVLSANTV
jgi:hypothetical protein